MDGDSKCPVMSGANLQMAVGSTANQRWWPNQLNLRLAQSELAAVRSDGQGGFDYADAFRSARPRRCPRQRPRRPDDRQSGLVAGGLRPLRPALHPGWRGTAPAPTGPATGAAAAAPAPSASRRSTAGRTMATSTRRAACCGRSSRSMAASPAVGRPAGAGRDPCALEIDGLRDLSAFAGGRRRRLGAGRGHLLGPRDRTWLATSDVDNSRYSAATATSPTRLAAVQMGLIYVNPEGPERQPRPHSHLAA